MKSVLISIRPEWCEKIAAGHKTIEVRKSMPNLKAPFKCYIYCTDGDTLYRSHHDGVVRLYSKKAHEAFQHHTVMNGKVIGEFVCDRIDQYLVCVGSYKRIDILSLVTCNPVDYGQMCLTEKEFADYGAGKTLLGWHISELKIYDYPLKITQFLRAGECSCGPKAKRCPYLDPGEAGLFEDDCYAPFDTTEFMPILRPPQSWCYVED